MISLANRCCRSEILLTLLFVLLPLSSAFADDDPFDSIDDEGVVGESGASGAIFGAPGESGNGGAISNFSIGGIFGATGETGPAKDQIWEDIHKDVPSLGGTASDEELYKNSPEMLINDELNRALPTREPFGDRLEDVEKRLGN